MDEPRALDPRTLFPRATAGLLFAVMTFVGVRAWMHGLTAATFPWSAVSLGALAIVLLQSGLPPWRLYPVAALGLLSAALALAASLMS